MTTCESSNSEIRPLPWEASLPVKKYGLHNKDPVRQPLFVWVVLSHPSSPIEINGTTWVSKTTLIRAAGSDPKVLNFHNQLEAEDTPHLAAHNPDWEKIQPRTRRMELLSDLLKKTRRPPNFLVFVHQILPDLILSKRQKSPVRLSLYVKLFWPE